MAPSMLGMFVQVCPKCGRRARRLTTEKKLVDKTMVVTSKPSSHRGRNWSFEEPTEVWVYTYRITRKCRACGHEWAEAQTKQRPW